MQVRAGGFALVVAALGCAAALPASAGAGEAEWALSAAEHALDLAARSTPVGLERPIAGQRRNLATADTLLRLAREDLDPRAKALRAVGSIDATIVPEVGHADGTPGDLARLVHAFLRFDRATREALRRDEPTPPRSIDLGPIIEARAALLREALSLAAAPGAYRSGSFPEILCLDPDGVDSIWTANCLLTVDVGGDDVYLNNAGGSGVGGCSGIASVVPGAAALVDLAGDDRYVSERDCAVNGGGAVGSGFLLDASGNDVYAAGSTGTNGGAVLGTGLLVDLSGDDRYEARGTGTNGGSVTGAALLLDLAGDDAYVAGSQGVNGGAWGLGTGFLVDLGGTDAYEARDLTGVPSYGAANGGGALRGSGFLMDVGGGLQVFRSESTVSNGAAMDFGATGFLLSVGGDTRYETGRWATNGGAFNFAAGLLIDVGGNDAYSALGPAPVGVSSATNGGASAGVAVLIDTSGNDSYSALDNGVNGGTFLAGFGLLLDGGGVDAYSDTEGPCCTGSGTDVTACPKGTLGCQRDLL